MSHPMTPKEGMAVPEGFRLPWNTTRTMADVWAEDPAYEVARVTGAMGGAATKKRRTKMEKAA